MTHVLLFYTYPVCSILFLGGEPDTFACSYADDDLGDNENLISVGQCDVQLTNGTDNYTISCIEGNNGWTYDEEIGPTIVTEVFYVPSPIPPISGILSHPSWGYP